MSGIDSLRSLSWLHDPYRAVKSTPGFRLLSLFERWELLLTYVQETRGVVGQQDRAALDALDHHHKAHLLEWLEEQQEAGRLSSR